jgi:hypothetical protein
MAITARPTFAGKRAAARPVAAARPARRMVGVKAYLVTFKLPTGVRVVECDPGTTILQAAEVSGRAGLSWIAACARRRSRRACQLIRRRRLPPMPQANGVELPNMCRSGACNICTSRIEVGAPRPIGPGADLRAPGAPH